MIALNLFLLFFDHGFCAGHDKRTYWLIILMPLEMETWSLMT